MRRLLARSAALLLCVTLAWAGPAAAATNAAPAPAKPAPAPPAKARPAPSRSYGTWTNPSKSVRVAAQPCGAAMCGVVVWANAKAKADAAKGGSPNLIGMDLFDHFTQVDAEHWKGKVFVPDLNQHFSGTITVLDANTLIGKGCLFSGIGCKSQTWTRVK